MIKSLGDDSQLKYFKKELIKVLAKQANEDKKELKKAIGNYESFFRVGYELVIEKGKAANIGETREWKGKKFRKIAPGKWRRIYESEGRGAKQSARIIAKKIMNAQSVDELLNLVMENVNRFQDENGKTLPIVEELKNAVNSRKAELNSGKPSTQKQIKDFQKDKYNKQLAKESIKPKTEKESPDEESKKESPKKEKKEKTKKGKEEKGKNSTGKLKIPEGIDGIPTKDSEGIRLSNIDNLSDMEVHRVYSRDDSMNGSELAIDPTNWSDKIFDLGYRIKTYESFNNPARADEMKELKSNFKKLFKLKSDFDNLPKAEKVKLLEKNIETLKANKAKVEPAFNQMRVTLNDWVSGSIKRIFDAKIKSMELAITRAKKGQILENTFKTDGIVDGNGNYIRCWFRENGNGNIRVSVRDYDHLPKTLQTDTDLIKNDSDSYTDYFDNDSMVITPSNPYYNEAVKVAFKQQYKKDIAAYKKATENSKKLVKNGGEIQEEEKKEVEPLNEKVKSKLEDEFKSIDEIIKKMKPGYYNSFIQPPRLRIAISRMTDEQKREVYSYAIKKYTNALGAYGKVKKDAGFTAEQLDKFLDEKLGEDFGKTKKEEETKESKTAKISAAAITTLKKLKADFMEFEKSSGIDRNFVEKLFYGKESKEPKKETKSKQETWVSPLPSYEKNLAIFDTEELEETLKKEKDETKKKVLEHVISERKGVKKSFSDSIRAILRKVVV